MSVYHGAQGHGAARAHRETKRKEAEARNAATPPERRSTKPGCPSGKQILYTEKEAQTELVGALVRKNRGNNRRKECRWYQCPLCGFYHLTSQPLKVKEES